MMNRFLALCLIGELGILACPAHDQADQLALEMLRQLLDPAQWNVEVAGVEMPTSNLLTQVAEQAPAAVCIGALPPGGWAHTRYLCKKLRARFPDVKIVVGRWGHVEGVEENREQLVDAGADMMATTMLESRNQLCDWLPLEVRKQREAAECGMGQSATTSGASNPLFSQ